jgi:hypothetical protein
VKCVGVFIWRNSPRLGGEDMKQQRLLTDYGAVAKWHGQASS